MIVEPFDPVTPAGSSVVQLSRGLAEQVQPLVRWVEDQPAIPASEVRTALRYLSLLEFGLAQTLQYLSVCVIRSARGDLFWSADSPSQTTQALPVLVAVAERLSAAGQEAADAGVLLTDAREDLSEEAAAVTRRLKERRRAELEEVDQTLPDPELAALRRRERQQQTERKRQQQPEKGQRSSRPTRTRLSPEDRQSRNRADLAAVGPEWLTVTDAAAVLGVAASTLQGWSSRMVGPTRYRVKRFWAYRVSEVVACRDQRRGKSSAA